MVAELFDKVSCSDALLQSIEEDLSGSPECRLSRVTLGELFEKCQALYTTNQKILAHLSHDTSTNHDDPTDTFDDVLAEKAGEDKEKPTSPNADVCAGNSNAEREVDESSSHGKCSKTELLPSGDDNGANLPHTLSETPLRTSSQRGMDSCDTKNMEPKTPTLAAWKLSSSTRHLFNNATASCCDVELSKSSVAHEEVSDTTFSLRSAKRRNSKIPVVGNRMSLSRASLTPPTPHLHREQSIIATNGTRNASNPEKTERGISREDTGGGARPAICTPTHTYARQTAESNESMLTPQTPSFTGTPFRTFSLNTTTLEHPLGEITNLVDRSSSSPAVGNA
jgi:hypothetical protein